LNLFGLYEAICNKYANKDLVSICQKEQFSIGGITISMFFFL